MIRKVNNISSVNCLFIYSSKFVSMVSFLCSFSLYHLYWAGGLVVRGLVPFLGFLLVLLVCPIPLAIVGGRVVLGLVPCSRVPCTFGLLIGLFVGVVAGL